jgi:glycosyltransferase involved in cell wall biosynthesis
MKLGLVARADNTGLGIQTWEFYRHMKPSRTLVVDISSLNHNKQFPDRYTEGEVMFCSGFPNAGTIEEFLQGLDIIFVAESAYNYHLIQRARELGVKTAIQYNYEFFDWFVYGHYPLPDLFIAPSTWHYEKIDNFCRERNIKHVYLHCPVDRQRLPYRKITKARTFVHPLGKPAAHDRNGTMLFLMSLLEVKSNITVRIRTQSESWLYDLLRSENKEALIDQMPSNVAFEFDTVDHEDYWKPYGSGDVMVMPRRYGGNCLPLNESLSVGMPCIMTDLSPNNQFLPRRWLVPSYKGWEFTPRTSIDVHTINVSDLAHKIDELAGMSELDFWYENKVADMLADSISWKLMQPKYQEVLENL